MEEDLKKLLNKFESEFNKTVDKLSTMEKDKVLYFQGYRDGMFEAFASVADILDGTNHTKRDFIIKNLG